MNNTVLEVARRIGMYPQALREWLKQSGCPIGMAYKPQGSTHYTYVIYPTKVDEYFGRKCNEEHINK